MTTQEKIIAEALRLFAETGYPSVSMQDIAASVGIKKASLYFHFSGKQAIYGGVLQKVLTEFEEIIENLTDESLKAGGLYPSLLRFFEGFIDYILEKTVLQFWTRMYIFPPKHLSQSEMEKCKKADSLLYSSLKKILTRFHKPDCDIETMALIRLAGGYISIGTDPLMTPWKIELAEELRIFIAGISALKEK